MNNVVLIGRLTTDSKLRYLPTSGTPVASFRLAVDGDYKKSDGTKQVDFIPVEIIGKSAEFVANYLGKGRLVGINGSLRVQTYKKDDGTNTTFTKVVSTNIKALDSSKDKTKLKEDNETQFEPSFQPQHLDGFTYQAIEDDDIPF